MNTLKKLLLLSALLVSVGNSWATNMLGTPSIVPPGSKIVYIILLLQNPSGRNPAHEICQEVDLDIVFVDINGFPEPSDNVVDIELVSMSLVGHYPATISPGEAIKAIYTNREEKSKTITGEIKVTPSEALGVCKFKAAMQLVDSNNIPIGAPVDFSTAVKVEPAPHNNIRE